MLKVNKTNTLIRRCFNVFIINSEHNSHHFLAFQLLTLNRKMFTGIISSDYDTSYIIVQRKMTCLRRRNLLLHSGYAIWEATWLAKGNIPLTEILLICQISFIFILCLFNKGDDTLTEISSFKAKWDKQKFVKMCQPARRDENYTNAYVTIEINKELNLFLPRGY